LLEHSCPCFDNIHKTNSLCFYYIKVQHHRLWWLNFTKLFFCETDK
jgi:hypothetical protein